MSISINVTGFRPPDEQWKSMKAIWDACKSANVTIPFKVANFFNDMPPDDSGVEVELENSPCCNKYDKKMRVGFEITISKLPKDIKIIRFWNGY